MSSCALRRNTFRLNSTVKSTLKSKCGVFFKIQRMFSTRFYGAKNLKRFNQQHLFYKSNRYINTLRPQNPVINMDIQNIYDPETAPTEYNTAVNGVRTTFGNFTGNTPRYITGTNLIQQGSGNKEEWVVLNLTTASSTVPLLMSTYDLYIVGFVGDTGKRYFYFSELPSNHGPEIVAALNNNGFNVTDSQGLPTSFKPIHQKETTLSPSTLDGECVNLETVTDIKDSGMKKVGRSIDDVSYFIAEAIRFDQMFEIMNGMLETGGDLHVSRLEGGNAACVNDWDSWSKILYSDEPGEQRKGYDNYGIRVAKYDP